MTMCVCSGRQTLRLCRVRLHRSRPAAARAGGSRSGVGAPHRSAAAEPTHPRAQAGKSQVTQQQHCRCKRAQWQCSPPHASLVGVPTSRCPAPRLPAQVNVPRQSTSLQADLPLKHAPPCHLDQGRCCCLPSRPHDCMQAPVRTALSLSQHAAPSHSSWAPCSCAHCTTSCRSARRASRSTCSSHGQGGSWERSHCSTSR